jgi:cell division protein FtsB
MVEQREKLWREIDALKAENERLRRAAEEFISWFDGEEYLDEIAYQVDSLRAALEKK